MCDESMHKNVIDTLRFTTFLCISTPFSRFIKHFVTHLLNHWWIRKSKGLKMFLIHFIVAKIKRILSKWIKFTSLHDFIRENITLNTKWELRRSPKILIFMLVYKDDLMYLINYYYQIWSYNFFIINYLPYSTIE